MLLVAALAHVPVVDAARRAEGAATADAGAATADPDTARPKPVRVDVVGLDGSLRENVRDFLSIQDVAAGGILSEIDPRKKVPRLPPADVRRRHRRAPEEIRRALQPYGYYRPQIEADLQERNDRWEARYRVDPGPPTTLSEVEIQVTGAGRDAPEVEDALAQIRLEPGDRLSHPRYQDAKSRLFDTAYDAGFLDVRWVRSQIRVLPSREQAEIHLILDTGPRYYFGDVTIDQDILADEFVARYVPFEPGDRYEVEDLLDLQVALADSDYFGRVEIRADPKQAGPDHRIPVHVKPEPEPPRRYEVGAGYATDTGARLNLSAILRRINRRGHQVQGDLLLSEISSLVAARYAIPIEDLDNDVLQFTAQAKTERVGDAETDTLTLTASRSDDWRGLRRRLYVEAERATFEFGAQPLQHSSILVPGIFLEAQELDDLQYPRRGFSASLDVHGSMQSPLSDTTFLRAEVKTRFVRALGERTRVLLHAAGGALSVEEFGRLPPEERFFTGGDRSVRGYDYRQIGPRNDDNDVVGGDYMFLGSVELEHLFWGNYGAAVFVDAGDAFDENPEAKVGAGLGFRWRAPIGMVRVDLAHPFDDPDRTVRLHLSIGADL